MATTSIWRVKGWLGKVVIYAENPEKTANPKFYADRELTEHDGQQLTDVIRYAVIRKKRRKRATRTAHRSTALCRASTALPPPPVMKCWR